jgi:hypothetical protein
MKRILIIFVIFVTTFSFDNKQTIAQSAGLVAYYPFNGNADDASGNGYHGNALGANLTADRFGNPNSAYGFDGVDDYIAVNNFPVLDRTFTYAAWLRVLGTAQHHQSFGAHGEGGAVGETWNFGYNTDQKVWDTYDRRNGTWQVPMDIGSSWTHVAIVYESHLQHIYVNGVCRGSRNITTPIPAGLSNTLRIGTLTPGDQQFQGMIDEVRIYNRALNAVEIQALCGALVAYYPFNGNARDSSGNGHHGTANGATLTTDRLGNPNSAYSFDGVDDYILIPAIDITTDLSISFWLKTTSSNSNSWPSNQFIIDRDLCGVQRDWSVGLGQGGKIQFNTGANIDHVLTSSSDINDDTWKHIVVVRDAGNQKKEIYVNGILSASSVFDNQPFQNNAINIYFGASVCLTSQHDYFNGSLDEIRLYNRVLTAAEIQELYKGSGLLAYYPFNGNANDESGNGHHGTVNGPTLTTDRFGNAERAYSFDGMHKDYNIQCNNPVSGGIFSLAVWIYTLHNSNDRIDILDGGTIDAVDKGFHLYKQNNTIWFDLSNHPLCTGKSNIANGNWHFIAAISSGDSLKLYVDGKLEDAKPANADISGSNFYIGNNAHLDASWSGKIDEVRIYDRALSEKEIQAFCLATVVESKRQISVPGVYRLSQNYPNPLRASAGTLIRYELPTSEQVVVKVYNSVGQEVRTLVNAVQPSGHHQVNWDGRDEQGRVLPSGLYLYRLQAGSFVQSYKMLLVR